jgi:hypothetical protein
VQEVFYIRHSHYWSRGALESDHDGSIRAAFADASDAQECSTQVESRKPVRGGNALRLPVATQEWAEASLLGCSAEPKNQARICEPRNSSHGMAYFSAFRRKHPGQHGKTSTHDPRAPQQPQCYQPYLQATSKTMRLSPGRLVDASLPTELLSANKSTLVQQILQDNHSPAQ